MDSRKSASDGLGSRKITCAALLATTLVAVSASRAGASVVYSGLKNIDVDLAGNGLFIDFDGAANSDGTGNGVPAGWDLNLVNFFDDGSVSGTFVNLAAAVVPNGTDDALVAHDSGSYFVDALTFGTTVGPSSTFCDATFDVDTTLLAFDVGGSTGGYWDGGASQRFLGVRFRTASNQLDYGWVRVNLTDAPDYHMTVVDWAYETSGNAIQIPSPVPLPASAVSGAAALALLGAGAVVRRARRSR